MKTTDKHIHVIEGFCNDGLTFNEQLKGDRKYKKIQMHDIYQCNRVEIHKWYQGKSRCNSMIIGARNPLQRPTPHPSNDSYDLTNNTCFAEH